MRLSGYSVLVVDDEPILSTTFGLLLERDGATVHLASNGAAALTVLQREPVDIILCDQQMPVMDGLTFLRAMRDRQVHVPVVLFVNGIDRHGEAEYLGLGVRATLTKPVMPDRLSKVLLDVLLLKNS